jgi:hypothetical protein
MGVRRVLAAFLGSDSSLLSKKGRSARRREKGPRLPRGSERASSRRTQIAQQNCSAGERTSAGGNSAIARPASEHAIWQSEVRLKGVAGGVASVSEDTQPDM